HVGQGPGYENGIAPAMVEGLEKIHGSFVSRGCQFFDMRWNFMPRRFDARYAKAVLIAIEGRGAEGSPRPGDEDYCIEAFKSQVANSEVQQAFYKDVFPSLTDSQKALGDRLSKEPA